MSEWIKFSFSTTQDATAWLVPRLDGTNTNESGSSIGPDQTTRDVWVEIDDAVASGSGSHNIQINVESTEGATPCIKLDSIQLGDQVHTNESGSINDEVTVYNPNSVEYQTLDVVVDSVGQHDIGNGGQEYAVSNWITDMVIGNGAWKLSFSCPYIDWYNTVHND